MSGAAGPVGLTGGIACGKSTLAEALRARGWHLIDTDEISRRLTQPGEALWKNVVDAFGPSILQPNKSIDRKVLGQLVFADPASRNQLNEITHPAIRRVWLQERTERARTHPQQSLVVMIPLLYECALAHHFARVWAVGASRATQLRRLQLRGLSATESMQRIESQWPVAEKLARADLVFWGNGPAPLLAAQLDQMKIS